MERFGEWLHHRQDVLGFASPAELAEAALLPAETIESIHRTGTLRGVGRSARAWLARSLKVTLRGLEALSAGRLEWIDDGRQVDLDRLTPDALRVRREPSGSREPRHPCEPSALQSQPCDASRGIPIVGRVLAGGVAEFWSDGLMPGDANRLPIRYPDAPDAFALATLHPLGSYPAAIAMVFRAAPPGQLRPGDTALLTRSDGDGESLVCRVRDASGSGASLRLSNLDAAWAGFHIDLEHIVRAARVLGAHAIGGEGNPTSVCPANSGG